MADPSDNELEFLLAIDRSALVPWVEGVLRDAGVPFQSGLVSGAHPRVVFLVPRRDQEGHARQRRVFAGRNLVEEGDAAAGLESLAEQEPPRRKGETQKDLQH